MLRRCSNIWNMVLREINVMSMSNFGSNAHFLKRDNPDRYYCTCRGLQNADKRGASISCASSAVRASVRKSTYAHGLRGTCCVRNKTTKNLNYTARQTSPSGCFRWVSVCCCRRRRRYRCDKGRNHPVNARPWV